MIKKNKNLRGFSLVEMLIVVAIVSILAAASLPVYSNFYGRAQLNEGSLAITQALRQARESSFVRYNNSNYGVKFLSNSYVLYTGTSYASRTTSSDLTYSLDKSLSITTTLSNSEVNFSKGLGKPNTSGTITLTNVTLGDKVVSVNSSGLIGLGASWSLPSWSYRRTLTINHNYVSSSLANFPVLVSVSGLSNVNSDGSDIVFTASDGVTRLPAEITSYNSSTGSLVAWVKMSLVKYSASSADDIFYMYYGNPLAATPAANSTYGSQNVWTSYYGGVWHLDDSANESVGAYNGTPANTTNVAGKIGDALSFIAASSSSVTLPVAPFSGITTEVTISAWQYGATVQPAQGVFFYANSADGLRQFNIHIPWSGSVYWDAFGTVGVYDRLQKAAIVSEYKGQWNYWSFVKNQATGDMKIYLNGNLWASGTGKVKTYQTIVSAILQNGSSCNDGYVDEFRVSNTARNADWIATEYNNQSAPSSFITMGSQGTISTQ
ncbi:MAG: DUF2341 domain-containing protein [Candidatus Falkowbacteria bacterium]